MSSRDPNYLTLRHLQCYESDDTYVSTSLVLTAGPVGVGTWTPGSQVTGTTGCTGPAGMTGTSGNIGETGPFGLSYLGETGSTGLANDVGGVGSIGSSKSGGQGTFGQIGATGTIGQLSPIAQGVATVPANTSSLFVANGAITSNSMIVVFPLNWDSALTNIQVYLNPTTGFTISVSSPTLIFSTPGTYTNVPVSSPFNFEMIGAGGNGSSGGSGGGGGYIQGTITSPSTTLVKVVVGAVGGGGGGGPSSASYINVPGTGPLFAMAGAGGASDALLNVAGWGGGGAGTFTANVSPGGNANPFSGPYGGGGGSVTGSGQGGLAGSECPPSVGSGNPGDNAGSSGLYEQALGGSAPTTSLTPGGSGYAGGGSGCGGGGGSSFVNSTYVSPGFVSVAGNALTTELPGFGRSNQGGYVSITSTWSAIQVRWWILRY